MKNIYPVYMYFWFISNAVCFCFSLKISFLRLSPRPSLSPLSFTLHGHRADGRNWTFHLQVTMKPRDPECLTDADLVQCKGGYVSRIP